MEKKKWTEVEPAGESTSLPLGAYVVRIEKVTDYPKNDFLEIRYDVAEGEYKDFYKAETRPWVHQFKRYYTEKAEAFFSKFLQELEESNHGKFKVSDWQKTCDEQEFVGLEIGVVLERVLRTRDDGNDYSFTRVHEPIAAPDVRNGEFKLPPDVDERTKDADITATAESDDDLPF